MWSKPATAFCDRFAAAASAMSVNASDLSMSRKAPGSFGASARTAVVGVA